MPFPFFTTAPPITPPTPAGGQTNVRFRWQLGTCCACSVKAFKCGVQPQEWSLRMSGLTVVPAQYSSGVWAFGACEQWAVDQLGSPTILQQDVLTKRACLWAKAIELIPVLGAPTDSGWRPDCVVNTYHDPQETCSGPLDSACYNRIITFSLQVADHWHDIPQFQHGPPGYEYPFPVGPFGCMAVRADIWNYCKFYDPADPPDSDWYLEISDETCYGYSVALWYAPLNELVDINNPTEIELVPTCEYGTIENGLSTCPDWPDTGPEGGVETCSCDYIHSHLHLTPVPLP